MTEPLFWVDECREMIRGLFDRNTTHPSARFPFAFIHAGEGGCGYPAFYLKRRVKPGEAMASSIAAQLGGTAMTPGSVFYCGHCHQTMRTPRTAHIQELLPS